MDEIKEAKCIPVMIDHADYLEIINGGSEGTGCIAVPDKLREGDRMFCIESERISPTEKGKKFTGRVTVCKIRKLLKHPHIMPGYALVLAWTWTRLDPPQMNKDALQDIMDNYRKGETITLNYPVKNKKASNSSSREVKKEISLPGENLQEKNNFNGFRMMADSYRQAVGDGKLDKATADKDIRIFDFLATCDDDDFCRLVDSSAFNDIIKAYCEIAIERGSPHQGMFDEISAKEALNRYYGVVATERDKKPKSKPRSI